MAIITKKVKGHEYVAVVKYEGKRQVIIKWLGRKDQYTPDDLIRLKQDIT